MKNIKEIIYTEAEAIRSIPLDQEFEAAVELLYNKVHKDGGKIVVSGMGKAGQVANNIATTFCSTGSPAIFLHPSEAQHGDLGLVRENDVLVLLSNSGKTREIIELLSLARVLHEGLPVILITGNRDGDLVSEANFALFTGNPEEVCPLGLTPTTSSTVMTVIGDVLTVMLMQKINFGPADYAKRHHGGYLGEKSRNAEI